MSACPLSIIIPALNEAAILTHTLMRLQDMRERGHEVILVDGGSDDETASMSLALVDQVIDSPRGRARQMNRGASVARGEVLVFLHADTWLPRGADRIMLRALADKELAWGRFDVELSRERWLLPMVAYSMNLRSRLTGIATGDQAMFVHRSLYEQVGGFPDIPLMEDVAMSRCLKRVSPPLCLRETVGVRFVKKFII